MCMNNLSASADRKVLWSPSSELIENAPITRFQQAVTARYGVSVDHYSALHAWSIQHPKDFWQMLWEFADARCSVRGDTVLLPADGVTADRPGDMFGARWFPEARLNFAENLLRRNDQRTAIIWQGEDGSTREMNWAELVHEVCATVELLRAEGVVAGDRVVGFLPNIPEAVVAMLAAASIGAVWSSCSPDFGVNGVLDRFGQIAPKVLFTADGYRYAGKVHDSLATASTLVRQLPSLQRVVVIDLVKQGELDAAARAVSYRYSDVLETYNRLGLATDTIEFAQLPFDHPLYILYSSGTTGKPKCIVHGAGGTLLQHLKEQQLHVGLQPDEKLFFFTTCGWMMWNWLVSGLASEGTLLLYDGSPFHPDGNTLFNFAEQSGMNYFGTSAKFIGACHKAGIKPRETHKLPALKSLLSTGSPLVPESFDYVYTDIAENICLSSMSGGTDIVSCFALGNPALPVYRGELQCLGLGMDVQVFDDSGQCAPIGQQGELVCTATFPCMPVGFHNDPDSDRYWNAYFARYPGIWCHGDFVALTANGGLIIYGRSDAVLNPGGVRIGTAEIYRQVEQFDQVLESVVIGQPWQGDVRVVLFVRMQEGHTLDEALCDRLRRHIRQEATPRHVPACILEVPDIPKTRSGKIVELAVRKEVMGQSVDNTEALANPEALAYFRNRSELCPAD